MDQWARKRTGKMYIPMTEPLASHQLGEQIDNMLEGKIRIKMLETSGRETFSLDQGRGLYKDSRKLSLLESPKMPSKLNKPLSNVSISPIHMLSSIIFLCIGSDRATGDALGPLVGHLLNHIGNSELMVMGSLASPVHAKNIHATIRSIEEEYPQGTIIAIDACLGDADKVGSIIIENKPLSPGAGVEKKLPAVGDISIKGVVNAIPRIGGQENLIEATGSGEEAVGKAYYKNHDSHRGSYGSSMDSICSTRLFVVYQMAEMIVQGICKSQYIQQIRHINKNLTNNMLDDIPREGIL